MTKAAEEDFPLKDLVYQVVPSIYIENNTVKNTSHSAPVKAEIDPHSFQLVHSTNKLFKEIKLLVIKYDNTSDGNISLDFQNLPSFESLKYVYVVCTYTCSSTQIEQHILNLPKDVVLLYSVSSPE